MYPRDTSVGSGRLPIEGRNPLPHPPGVTLPQLSSFLSPPVEENKTKQNKKESVYNNFLTLFLGRVWDGRLREDVPESGDKWETRQTDVTV